MATMTRFWYFSVVGMVITHSAASSCPSSLVGSSCSAEAPADEVSLLTVATQVQRHRFKDAPEETDLKRAGYELGVYKDLYKDSKPGDKYGGTPPRPGSPSQCGGIMKAVLKAHGADGDETIPISVDSMMGAQFIYAEAKGFDAECCGKGTEYDKFIESNTEIKNAKQADFLQNVGKESMLIVVDVQKDFAVGSFGQPCWGPIGGNDRGDAFAQSIADLAHAMAAKGATIIISKDFHPSDHCSFNGKCKNTKDATETANERYINEFPSHCTFTMVNGVATPQVGGATPFCQAESHKDLPFCSSKDFVGAALHPIIEKLFWDLVEQKRVVDLVFKGINKDYDSFSVIPHTETKVGSSTELSADEVKWTGGYAISGKRKAACLATKNLEDPTCYPTADEITKLTDMRQMTEIMKTQKTSNLVSVGLVSDFCVKETSIFAKEFIPTLKSTAFANLARPSFDGKPGFPWMPTCPKEYCEASGGTTSTANAVFNDYIAAEVDVKVLIPTPALTAVAAAPPPAPS